MSAQTEAMVEGVGGLKRNSARSSSSMIESKEVSQ